MSVFRSAPRSPLAWLVAAVVLGSPRITAQAQAGTECAEGQYLAADVDTCVLCPAGRFNPDIGSTSCVDCPAGAFSIGGSTACESCELGRTDHDSSATTPCEPCAVYSFSDSTGAYGACTTCPEGKNAADVGASSSTECSVDAIMFACSEFECNSGYLPLTKDVEFPDPARSYCAGATCDLQDDQASADDDEAYAHDLATCCEDASCTAFEITFGTTPAGYTTTNASGTTVSGVGLACDADAHYSGTAVLTCDGSTFASPSGCELQGQCGSNPACP
eukprot:COSAG02_NODE_12460_length_1541_cov_5.705270_1_plen_275_part_10